MTHIEFFHVYEIIKQVNNWVLNLISSSGYPGLGFVMFLENVFPPIPSEIILPLAGSLTTKGDFSLAGITLVGMIGSVAGAWVFYGIGYFIDEKRVRSLIGKFGKWLLLSTNDLDRALNWFKKYGNWVVFFRAHDPNGAQFDFHPGRIGENELGEIYTLFSPRHRLLELLPRPGREDPRG